MAVDLVENGTISYLQLSVYSYPVQVNGET